MQNESKLAFSGAYRIGLIRRHKLNILSGRINILWCAARCVVVCVWYSSSLLHDGIHSVHVAIAFVRRERGGVGNLSVCLGGLLARCSLCPTLVTSGSVLSGLALSSLPTCTPQFSLLLSLLHRCFRSAGGQWFRGCLVGHVYRPVYSFPGSLQQRPSVSVSAGPFGAARNHNPTRTAIIFVCVDSFIQVLTDKHRMPNPSPITHSRFTPHSSGHGHGPPAGAAI